jgi:hypothetical protein
MGEGRSDLAAGVVGVAGESQEGRSGTEVEAVCSGAWCVVPPPTTQCHQGCHPPAQRP